MKKFLSIIVTLLVVVTFSSCNVKDKIKESVISYEDSKKLDPCEGGTHTEILICNRKVV